MGGTGIDFDGAGADPDPAAGHYTASACCSEHSHRDWIMADVSQTVIYELRDSHVGESWIRLPLKYFRPTVTHGEIQSRMVNDIETVNQTLVRQS